MSKINDLIIFLNRHKSHDLNLVPTITGMYAPLKGAWSLQGESLNKFWQTYMDIYTTFSNSGNRLGLGLTETQTDTCPLLIDIDIKTEVLLGEQRIYSSNDIISLIKSYLNICKKYIHFENDEAYIFEKPNPRLKDGFVKDGFHIMFMNIIVSKKVHRRIHQDVKQQAKETKAYHHLLGIQNENSLIDEAIVSNNWMIYGTVKKDDSHGYLCTRRYQDGELYDMKGHSFSPRYFSIQGHTLNELTDVGTNIMERVNVVESSNDDALIPDVLNESEKVKILLNMLSIERCSEEPLWIRVGMCLRNINPFYLNLWIDWSKQSKKFKDGECEKHWNRFKKNDECLKINSLSYWAKEDDPEAYTEYIQKSSNVYLEYSINCGAHYDIASILYCKYSDIYRCVNPKKSTEWYYFNNHRWKEMPGGYILMNAMSIDLSNDFTQLANTYKKLMLDPDPIIVKENKKKYDKCRSLSYQVKDNGFKTGVLKECARMFYDIDFERNLDDNVNLIGFENGVYDIASLSFRNGVPSDYVSKSTGIDYIEFSENDPIVQEIYHFFSKVHPNDSMREYVLRIFATFLGGSTDDQTFQIWTGGGSNGKSTCVELFERSFGPEYTGKFPVTLLTRDRSNSNACTPELQDVMRKRFASMQEPNDTDSIFTGAMKEYTGGDKIYSRGLYSKPTPFKPQFKLVMLCNKMPNIKGYDFGTWRRIRVVRHMSSFVDKPNPANEHEYAKDKKLCHKFDEWKEAFMWMLIERLKMYVKHGIQEPIEVLNASIEYKKKSDGYLSFMDDNFENTGKDADKVPIQHMYEIFKMWWRNTLNTPPPSKMDLIDYINANTKYRKQGKTHLLGIRFKNVEEMEC